MISNVSPSATKGWPKDGNHDSQLFGPQNDRQNGSTGPKMVPN